VNNAFVEPSSNGIKLWVIKDFSGPDEFVYTADDFGFLLDDRMEYSVTGHSSEVSLLHLCALTSSMYKYQPKAHKLTFNQGQLEKAIGLFK